MIETWEAFTIQGGRVGFLQRRTRPLEGAARLTETLTAFRMQTDEVRLRHALRWTEGSPPTWTSYEWSALGAPTTRVTLVGEVVTVRRGEETSEHAAPAGTWPGYGCAIRLRELGTSPGSTLSYPVLVDSSGEPEGTETLTMIGPEPVDGLDGAPIQGLLRVEHAIAGEPRNTFWVREDGTPVVSDWNGARSFLVTNRDEALSGLDGSLPLFEALPDA